MTSTECIERKNQPQAEINETETITSIKSNEEFVHWKKKQQDWQSVAKLTKWKGEKKMNKIKIKRETFIFVWINAPHHS